MPPLQQPAYMISFHLLKAFLKVREHQVVKLICLLLVLPATAMRRIKSYLRSTISQQLNATMDLHIHKEPTDDLDLNSIAKEFNQSFYFCKSIYDTNHH